MGPPGWPFAWVSDVQPRETLHLCCVTQPSPCSFAARHGYPHSRHRRGGISESSLTPLHPSAPSSTPPVSHTPTASPLVTLLPQAGPAAMALSSPTLFGARGPLGSSRNHTPAHGFPRLRDQVPPPSHHPASAGSTRSITPWPLCVGLVLPDPCLSLWDDVSHELAAPTRRAANDRRGFSAAAVPTQGDFVPGDTGPCLGTYMVIMTGGAPGIE